MKRHVIMVLGIMLLPVCLFLSCAQSHGTSEESMSQDQPESLVYAGNRYIYIGTVANQDIHADTPSNLLYIGSTSQTGDYDVYLIQGVDENEAIALKIGRGGLYSYCRYERVYGQDEPAGFVYQGRDYSNTGDGTPERFSTLDSVLYLGTTYDVYSIHGVDENQAIVLRIAKAGKTVGFLYYYFKYERR
jgi:hypothetical protein